MNVSCFRAFVFSCIRAFVFCGFALSYFVQPQFPNAKVMINIKFNKRFSL